MSCGDEFTTAVKKIQANSDTRGVLLTGAGQAFCISGDVAVLKARTQRQRRGDGAL